MNRKACHSHPLWTRLIHKQSGYREVKTPDGWVREHRFVMENIIGRKLIGSELVHHIDGDIQNNNINNLELMTRSEHVAHHNTGSVKSEETRRKLSIAGKGCQNACKSVLPSDLVGAVEAGMTDQEMASKFNVSVSTIYNKKRALGLIECRSKEDVIWEAMRNGKH